MHFDDRLATVLRLPSSGDALARIQYRQLIDILGRLPEDARSDAIEAGFARVEELGAQIGAADRARLVRQPLQPLTNARLLALFAEAEPEVALAAIGTARLDEAGWLRLVPALPVRARGILRHRRDLGPEVGALLDRLGIQDRGLPPAPNAQVLEVSVSTFEIQFPSEAASETPAAPPTLDEAEPFDLLDEAELPDAEEEPETEHPRGAEPISFADFEQAATSRRSAALRSGLEASGGGTGLEGGDGIGAIVRRIEEFRKAREHHAPGIAGGSPRLPLGDTPSASAPAAMDFATDSEGRVCWADGSHASALIGLNLAALDPMVSEPLDPAAPLPSVQMASMHIPGLALSIRHRQPLRAVAIEITGAPAVSGAWQVDAVPHFDPASGRFTGYAGRLRRPGKIAAVDAAPAAEPSEADRMRQVLHELRTPANAIQVAAEIIQQQLYGPAPHEYRALAAAIAGDCAHILAGFEELDRLVKLESGALGIESGESDLVAVLSETVARLKAWTEPRGSGFILPETGGPALPIAIERTEIERMIWRVFAVLAGMTAPHELLPVRLAVENGRVAMRVTLPSLLLARDAQSLFETPVSERGQSLSTGMFGIGFTLRLAAAEADAAGGSLQRDGDELRLSLPAFAASSLGRAQDAESRAL
jgi:hypothetical protein